VGQWPAFLSWAAVVISTTAHAGAAALEPGGAMAWWMAAMAAVCLLCALPMVHPVPCVTRSARHLFAMGVVMIVVHLAVLTLPHAGGHHRPEHAATSPHGAAMLAVVGVELVCLVLASTALRLGRRIASVDVRERTRVTSRAVPGPRKGLMPRQLKEIS